MKFDLEQGTEAILMPLSKSEHCSEQGCSTWAHFAISIDASPYAVKCRTHLPDGIIQEYWTMRLLLATQDGDERKARAFLRHVTAEARRNGYDRCASIADVYVQDARHTYSNQDMARGAEDMAKRIARSIRNS